LITSLGGIYNSALFNLFIFLSTFACSKVEQKSRPLKNPDKTAFATLKNLNVAPAFVLFYWSGAFIDA